MPWCTGLTSRDVETHDFTPSGGAAGKICLNQSEVLPRSGWLSVIMQYRISAVIPRTSFRGETSHDIIRLSACLVSFS